MEKEKEEEEQEEEEEWRRRRRRRRGGGVVVLEHGAEALRDAVTCGGTALSCGSRRRGGGRSGWRAGCIGPPAPVRMAVQCSRQDGGEVRRGEAR